jgi:Uncharacterized conserved protein
MHYEGSLEVNRSIKEVYDFLINPKEISTIVPDLESLEVIDQNNFNMKAKVGVAFIKGTMSLKFQIIEKAGTETCKNCWKWYRSTKFCKLKSFF